MNSHSIYRRRSPAGDGELEAAAAAAFRYYGLDLAAGRDRQRVSVFLLDRAADRVTLHQVDPVAYGIPTEALIEWKRDNEHLGEGPPDE